ncbi:hypothetical protein QFZ44_002337 [Pantoea agglomerans]|nr:hypothetical protein [Pantoea agglomerans]
MFKTTQSRFTATMIAFFVALLLVTVWVINQFVAPQLVDSESRLVRYQVDSLASGIVEQMNRVQAQQRAITEAASVMDSATIDTLLPTLVNQYQDSNVFGGGIWPLPNRRDPAKEKDSSFFARNASNELQVNTYWNSDAADKYWERNPGTKMAWPLRKASVPGQKPIRMPPARSRAPTVLWLSTKTARPGVSPPLM